MKGEKKKEGLFSMTIHSVHILGVSLFIKQQDNSNC